MKLHSDIIISRLFFFKCLIFFVCCTFVLAGMGAVFMGLRDIFYGFQTQNWKEAIGVIQQSTLKNYTSRSKDYYTPQITYLYSVNGSNYLGKQITYGKLKFRNKVDAIKQLEQFPNGKQITIFFDPHSPYRAVLQQGVQWDRLIIVGFGIGFSAFSLYLLLSTNKKLQQINQIKQI